MAMPFNKKYTIKGTRRNTVVSMHGLYMIANGTCVMGFLSRRDTTTFNLTLFSS